MFTYFHCYLPETWDAQVKAGLISDKTAGIRLVMSIRLDEQYKFNNMAAKDSPLFKLISEKKYPFYIDRLQGGDYIDTYPYDKELLKEYKKILNDRFFGFQMHEWLSNFKNDLDGLKHLPQSDWTAEKISADVFRRSPYPFLNLSSVTAEEMEKLHVKNLDDFLAAGKALFADRQEKTDGMLLSCNSYFLTYPQEIKLGVKRIMPEIGAQTPNTRIQMAFARGMAKAHCIPYGAYYESWGGTPFSVCCYQQDGKNEWGIKEAADFPFQMKGTNGGSSRSLQKRLHLYAYMAGAEFMSEEWGMCNTFYDWKNFELSPYGKVKKEFLDFVDRFDNVGKPITPIAAVVPKDFIVESAAFLNKYIWHTVYGDFKKVVRRVHRGLKKAFCSAYPSSGTERRTLLNCYTYDAIDIITEEEASKNAYNYYIDLTSSQSFAKHYSDKIIKNNVKAINKAIENYLPCTIKGNCLKQITCNEKNEYYLLLTNNDGISQTVKKGQTAKPFSTHRATITLKSGYALSVEKTDGNFNKTGNTIKVTLPAGGYLFAKIKGVNQ